MSDIQRVADLIDAYPRLQRQPAQVLLVLLEAKGRIVTQERFVERIRDLSGDYPTLDSIKTALKRARRVTGLEIEPIYGVGWRLVEPEKVVQVLGRTNSSSDVGGP